MANSEVRKQSACRWREDYSQNYAGRFVFFPTLQEASRALAVICLTEATSNYLAEFDPQALKQSQIALNGKSWEDFQ